MLTADGVSVLRGGRAILDRVSLAVPPGQLTVLLGPNGAGKSTLFSILSGGLRPDAGVAALDGQSLRTWRPDALARRRAVLVQRSELGFPMRVLEVVLLGRAPFAGRQSRDRDLAAVRRALGETDTTHLADRVFTTLSGGERQRVQLARVLAQIDGGTGAAAPEARFLMLDEPTAGLDLLHQYTCLEIARGVAAGGGGVLAVLHDLNLAAMFADRICLLRQGRVVAIGPPDTVITEPLLADTFGLPLRVTPHPTRGCPSVMAA